MPREQLYRTATELFGRKRGHSTSTEQVAGNWWSTDVEAYLAGTIQGQTNVIAELCLFSLLNVLNMNGTRSVRAQVPLRITCFSFEELVGHIPRLHRYESPLLS